MQAKRLKSNAYGIALGAVVAQVQSLPSTFHRSELRRKLKRGLPRQTAVGCGQSTSPRSETSGATTQSPQVGR